MTSTTRNILIGLALGVATGLFLGEKAGGFQLVAEAYLRLLQMTVLPYVMVSLIEGIGSLDGARARRLQHHLSRSTPSPRLRRALYSVQPISFACQ